MLEALNLNTECPFLALPVEIRQLVFNDLFRPLEPIRITARPPPTSLEDDENTTSWSSERESFAIARHSLDSQFLATCKQIHTEGLTFLYSQRTFDLTARESLKLLLHNIGTKNFSNLHQIILDWDALQDFAWSISKPDYAAALSGLHVIEMATWRNRHLDTTSTRWRNVKGYERAMCQAAADILHKHDNLKILAQEHFVRKGSITHIAAGNAEGESDDKSKQVGAGMGSLRVKWRFLSPDVVLKDHEIVVEIEKDLEILRATQDEATDGGFQLPMIDPF